MSDSVNHPKHYNAGKFEVIDVIDDWKLGFALGNTVKYIARAAHKGSELEDLKKARWYLDHRIKELGGSADDHQHAYERNDSRAARSACGLSVRNVTMCGPNSIDYVNCPDCLDWFKTQHGDRT